MVRMVQWCFVQAVPHIVSSKFEADEKPTALFWYRCMFSAVRVALMVLHAAAAVWNRILLGHAWFLWVLALARQACGALHIELKPVSVYCQFAWLMLCFARAA